MKLKLILSRIFACFIVFLPLHAYCDISEIHLTIKDHLFFPETLIVPANKKIKLVIDNQDATPEEFDSFDLNREKVIFGFNKAVIYIGPLSEGTYSFFGEYSPQTAQGTIIASMKEAKDAP
ncbi:cupredoxin domain-containing protein [Pseudoalteromonas denitrificans]|uniref:Cupredoxin-like domain-containing protein n=1 Tax=Pseudoalteromonas denitrificans DSM 6059 TaxID=1123010 RepID=A0A1I1FIK8_9GAMM|nr:cupredoxin domain-containing protein [Pseudoalteromonas denitrificans]SFB96910.1 Cupredoxin-like domain-containing protein [Pseudoalteromonas denitrificans DSM 6059]